LATTATYHVRAYIKTQSGAVYYGENRTFTTTQVVSLPAVAVTTVSAIRTDRATFQSSVTSDGNSAITDYGFVYATWQNPTVDAAEKLSAGAGDASFGKTALELAEGTTYYVRAYATNAMGTAYGDEASFSTLAVTAPTLAAVSVSGVGISDATLTGSVTDNGNAAITEAGFCWSENPYPTTSDNKISCGTGTALSASLSNLNDGTTYYVRAYAINSKGTGYSADATFTTITLPSNVIFVSSQGNDSNDGRSWSKAKKTISAAMTAANVGEQVWVTNATYQESVTLKEGVALYGGFSGTEIAVNQRTAGARTILLRNRFIQNAAFSTSTVVDGFEASMASSAINLLGGCQFNNLAISSCSGAITITDCEIDNFTFSNNSELSISNSTVQNCSFSGNGNFIFTNSAVSTSTLANSANITLSNTMLTNSTATGSGVIYMQDNSRIEACSLTGNSYVHMDGGNLINCKIQNNNGGGVYVTAGGGNIEGCIITGNGAYHYAYSVKHASYRSYIYYGISGIYIDGTTKLHDINIYNCTISNAVTDNISRYTSESDTYGMGIYAIKGTVNIINSIIFNSDNTTRGYPVFVWDSGVSLYASNILSPINFTTGRGNVVITNFEDLKLSTSYALQSGSPAINAGDNSFVETAKDVNGNTRIQGGTVDIGAVESSY
jgi:hypothetical protein